MYLGVLGAGEKYDRAGQLYTSFFLTNTLSIEKQTTEIKTVYDLLKNQFILFKDY